MNAEVLQVVQEKEPWIMEEKVPTEKAAWIAENEGVVDKKGRRKSWHAIKFDRKRRKGVVEPEARQKRPSWWNIFAGQQWPRYFIFCRRWSVSICRGDTISI